MANNFFLNQDPLLFQTYQSQIDSENNYRKQLNDAMMQYKMYQQQNQPTSVRDYIGELDNLTKNVGEMVVSALTGDEEYQHLKSELMAIVQDELMDNIKWKINTNPTAVKNIERQTEIINRMSKKTENEQRKNLNELNDYVKNYSNMTFDEYKQLKNDENRRIQEKDTKQSV